MAEILNKLPLAARWILMVAVLVLLVVLAALVVSQIQAEADSARLSWLGGLFGQAASQPCLRDAADFDQPNICTAEDMELTLLELVEGPEVCTPGELIEVELAATLQSRSSERYDIGFYIAEDGGNALDRGTSCFRDFLHPTSADNQDLDLNGGFGPFYNGEVAQDDECGDLTQDASALYHLNEGQTITIMCQDSDGNGVADVGTAISWDINRTTDCTNEGDAVPDQTSKCRAGAINIAGLLVAQYARLELIKSLEPIEDPGLFNLYIGDIAMAEGVSNLGTTGVVTVTAGTIEEPGETHQLSETAGAETALPDYAISLDCVYRNTTDPAGSGSGPGPHGITVQPDDDIVCTFTNTRRQAGITIRKETDPALITGTFEFASNDTPPTFTLAHGEEQAFTALTPLSTYLFTETVPIGWDLQQITCTGQVSSSVEHGETNVGVTLAPQESILCTFIDEPVPGIVVTKTVDPPSVMEPRGRVTYTVQVGNNSVADVTVDLTGLEDAPYGDLTDAGNTAIRNSTCQLTQTIAQGDSYTCMFQAAVEGAAGDLVTDTVTATAQSTGGVEIQVSDPATVSITAAPPILISVTKTVSPEVVYVPSGTVTYELGITNQSETGYDVRVSGLADDIYGDPTDVGNAEILSSTCALGEVLEPGDTYSCTFGAVVEGEVGFMVTDTFTATVIDRLQREASAQAQASVTLVTEPPPTGGAFSTPILALGLAMMGTSLLLAGTATRLRKR